MPLRTLITVLLLTWLGIGCDSSSTSPNNNQTGPDRFVMKGADVSFLPELRASGVQLRNRQDQVEDPLLTLKKSGVNTIRLRLWHTPDSPTSGFESVKQLSREAKEMGFNVLLTVHYSDTWADPGQQHPPRAWNELNFEVLKDSLSAYTSKIMHQIAPDFIQIGNEINPGFLWPHGRIEQLESFKELLATAITAVRGVNSETKIMLHFAGFEHSSWFFEQMKTLDYDLIGLSYYPFWHGKYPSELITQMYSLMSTFNKPVSIVETAYPFTLAWNDWTHNVIGQENQLLESIPATPEGQKNFLLLIKSLSSAHPMGFGFCYWGGEWVSFRGPEATDGSSWENQAFWDFDNKALPVLDAFSD